MYLTTKSQHLHVPERIFFHLVESREEDYPFAFLATYATRGESGKVQHVAAALYGVGARLDEQPLLFFELRGSMWDDL